VTQGEDQTESRDSIEHACLESGWLARLALVNDNEQKLYNYLNAHGLGVYYTITTSHGMNHHYSTAGLSPSAIAMGLAQPQCMSHDDWAEILLEHREDWEKALEMFLGADGKIARLASAPLKKVRQSLRTVIASCGTSAAPDEGAGTGIDGAEDEISDEVSEGAAMYDAVRLSFLEGIEDGDEVRAEETVGDRGSAEGIDRTVIEECYGIAQDPDAVGEVAIIKTVEQLLRAFVYTHAVPIIMKTIENTGQSGRNPDVEELEAAKSRFHDTCATIGKIYQDIRDAGNGYASELQVHGP
jgi:hypothetical protein